MLLGKLYILTGPFDYPQHFSRFNLFGKFNSQLTTNTKLTLSVSTFASKWRAAGEIPNRAIAEGYIGDRFGVIDSGQNGKTNKTIVNLKLNTSLGNNFTLENQASYLHTYFDLFTNFTFYYVDPINGDEFNQHEVRDSYGYNGKISHQIIFRMLRSHPLSALVLDMTLHIQVGLRIPSMATAFLIIYN